MVVNYEKLHGKFGHTYARCVQVRPKLVLVTIAVGTEIKISENDHMFNSFFFHFFSSIVLLVKVKKICSHSCEVTCQIFILTSIQTLMG